jgi:ribosomal-protein-alanine acetyltransferase
MVKEMRTDKDPTTPLRRATLADVPSIVELERSVPNLVHWSEQSYKNIFQPGAPERIFLVIEDNDELQAFLVARLSGAECELENLVVADQHRRRGLASQLLHALIKTARERNLERVLLELRESNQAARALYGKFGFVGNGRRRVYYSDPPEDAILLALALNCTSAGAPNR